MPGSEIPAEVDLGATEHLAGEGEDLGVAKRAAIAPRALVGDEDLIADFREPDELEAVSEFGQQRSK